MQEEMIKDNNCLKVKILKCNKCNTVPYFKFYIPKYEDNLKLFLKCKCNGISTSKFDVLEKYFCLVDKSPIKEKKFKSSYLTDDIYKQILNGYKLAKEKLYVKLKEIKEAELKILYDKINKIENIYQEVLKQNEQLLNIIQILIDTYENYKAENNKTFEILSQNIINNANFNLEIKNIFNDNYYSEEKIIYVNNYKYNLQHLKTISLPISDYNNKDNDNDNIKLVLLSSKKILAFCKGENGEENLENIKNKILFITLNDDYTIKHKKIIDNFFNYVSYFELDKEKLFFYGDKNDESHILNIKTFEINKFHSNYNSFFNYINGNIIGFNSNEIGIINIKGEVLLSKETEQKNYNKGLLLSNNNLIFANSIEIFLLNEKLAEIKTKKIVRRFDYIRQIVNIDKKIIINSDLIYICNLDLEIHSIIAYYNYYYRNKIYGFYMGNYITFYDTTFAFMEKKKYMISEYEIPYLFHSQSNKLIFGRLRDEKNKYKCKHFKVFCENKKIFIFFSNNILIYQLPN